MKDPKPPVTPGTITDDVFKNLHHKMYVITTNNKCKYTENPVYTEREQSSRIYSRNINFQNKKELGWANIPLSILITLTHKVKLIYIALCTSHASDFRDQHILKQGSVLHSSVPLLCVSMCEWLAF